MKHSKIFFETSVIIGAAQCKLIEEDSYVKACVSSKLIDNPERYKYSKSAIDVVMSEAGKRNLEPLVSFYVKTEIRDLTDKKDKLVNKIIKPLRIESAISKLGDSDRRLFEEIYFKVFFIKLPLILDEMLDRFGSFYVEAPPLEATMKDLFDKVFRPLMVRYNFLSEKFELSGMDESESRKDRDYDEYLNLKRALDSFESVGGNYKKLTDLIILSEAIYKYDQLKREQKEAPDFYFVTCDHIFLPFQLSFHSPWFFSVVKSIKESFGVVCCAPKYLLEKVLSV